MDNEKKPLTQINAYVPTEIKQEFKLECLKAGKTMSDVVEMLVTTWIKEQHTRAKAKG
jgi:antitoxin component of RelBE/YafQ-DinJ toxin-antitoxin module